tara:strand:+ start:359 stop:832 length:474 start_codon:yes stop_codon:yes gene_type:complete
MRRSNHFKQNRFGHTRASRQVDGSPSGFESGCSCLALDIFKGIRKQSIREKYELLLIYHSSIEHLKPECVVQVPLAEVLDTGAFTAANMSQLPHFQLPEKGVVYAHTREVKNTAITTNSYLDENALTRLGCGFLFFSQSRLKRNPYLSEILLTLTGG